MYHIQFYKTLNYIRFLDFIILLFFIIYTRRRRPIKYDESFNEENSEEEDEEDEEDEEVHRPR